VAKLNTYVHVHDKDGISHAFGPDDTVPEWAEKAITNPDVWADKPESDEGGDGEGDEFPEGDITDKWTVNQLKAYAKAEDIDLGDAKSKADILAKIAAE
jgi:hypothetical protein